MNLWWRREAVSQSTLKYEEKSSTASVHHLQRMSSHGCPHSCAVDRLPCATQMTSNSQTGGDVAVCASCVGTSRRQCGLGLDPPHAWASGDLGSDLSRQHGWFVAALLTYTMNFTAGLRSVFTSTTAHSLRDTTTRFGFEAEVV